MITLVSTTGCFWGAPGTCGWAQATAGTKSKTNALMISGRFNMLCPRLHYLPALVPLIMTVMARLIVSRPKFPFLRLPLARRLHRLARFNDLLDQRRPHFGLFDAKLSVIVAVKILAPV